MNKIIIQTIALGMILLVSLSFAACNNKAVTLANMKNTLTGAGYTIIEDADSLPENTVNGFIFVFNGAHGSVNIPVLEFKDNESANAYAATVNESGDWLAIVNGRFLTAAEAHHGTPHGNEKTFLKNLINGKPLK